MKFFVVIRQSYLAQQKSGTHARAFLDEDDARFYFESLDKQEQPIYATIQIP